MSGRSLLSWVDRQSLEVLLALEPDIEAWQIAERFGVSVPQAISLRDTNKHKAKRRAFRASQRKLL